MGRFRGGEGRIILTASSCQTSDNNGVIIRDYAISSLLGVQPTEPILGPSAIGVNNIALVDYEYDGVIRFAQKGTSEVSFPEVDGYEWELPTGWSIVSGGNTRSISVQPSACTGGNIRVRGINTCSPNNLRFSEWSAPFPVTRSIPQPGPITGPAVAVCKRTAPVTYSVPPVSGATSYTWTLPTGWQAISGSTSNSIQVRPSGEIAANNTLTVVAEGCGLQSVPRSISIPFEVTDPATPLSISNATVACFGGTNFSVVNAAFLPAGTTFS